MEIHHCERVLLAEPDSGYSLRLTERLVAQGHCVLTVESGAEALNSLDDFHPTMVIADLALQTGAGGVVDVIRERLDAKELPILLLGDGEHVDEVADAVGRGGVTYLHRGAQWTHFDRTFDTVCGRRGGSGDHRTS